MCAKFEQMFADMTSSPEVANQLIAALRADRGLSDSPIVATELIAALRADSAASGQGSPAVARELLNALGADAAADAAADGGGGGGSEVAIQTEDQTPRETRHTQVRGGAGALQDHARQCCTVVTFKLKENAISWNCTVHRFSVR